MRVASDEIVVAVGPGLVADAGLLAEIADREFTRLGVNGTVVHARDAAHLFSSVRERDVAVVLPGPGDGVRSSIGQPLGPSVVVWVDIDRVDGARHIHGRGIAGLTWGIRHAVHRARHPAIQRITYGPSPEQWADLYLPTTATPSTPGIPGTADTSTSDTIRAAIAAADGAVPVVALIHGGYWRSIWAADLMEELCEDLARRGFAVWNLEYRRPDRHGWAATTADIATGLAALTTLPTITGQGAATPVVLDLDRIAVAGHSAGGQLALRAAADGSRMALAVSLAGVLDLVQGDRRKLSAGAVAAALGRTSAPGGPSATSAQPRDGGPSATSAQPGDEDPYAASSPLHRLPLGTPQLIVQGRDDDLDLVDFARRHAALARQAGDDVTYLEQPGDHFDVITPAAPIWQATVKAIADALT
ncbi:acetyl esterase/lipase [Nonomuraea fuscirosea]|uniref:Acetyl esterase/lipase n=1 Tax=Nonomuraea fuscirosea TaxID=1291556 RepID=A0A2T0MKA2_9ACTN|nr:alpha/beta hydrolase [Nonomuraea fuscirosea]PRX58057.1 acetyl esterase/lipase [Nonomuraea fuscirosea]